MSSPRSCSCPSSSSFSITSTAPQNARQWWQVEDAPPTTSTPARRVPRRGDQRARSVILPAQTAMPSGWYCNSNRPVVVSLHGLVLCWMPAEKTAQRGLRSARNQHQIASKLIPGRKSTRTWKRRQAAQATALTVATLMRARRARLHLFEPKLYRIRTTESARWLKAWVFQCHRWTRDVRSKRCFLGEKYKVWTLVEALFLHKQARSVQGGQGEHKHTLQKGQESGSDKVGRCCRSQERRRRSG